MHYAGGRVESIAAIVFDLLPPKPYHGQSGSAASRKKQLSVNTSRKYHKQPLTKLKQGIIASNIDKLFAFCWGQASSTLAIMPRR